MNPELLAKLAAWDAAGFLIGENEDAEAFLHRMEETAGVNAEFEEELAKGEPVTVFDQFEVSADRRISPELADEAAEITDRLYGFRASHVPGFYLTREIGALWGGCLIGDPDARFAVFLLRDAFRRHRRFLNYRRDELLAHELCHSVRHVMNEPVLEEYFAYRTSPSALRRYLGNCFISDRDAWLFLIPVMLLPAAELVRALWLPGFPSWIFWLTAAVYPVYLLCRNALSRRLPERARRVLTAAGVAKPDAVLFRCTLPELSEIAGADPGAIAAMVDAKAAGSLRWQVMRARFFSAEGMPEEPAGAPERKEEDETR